MKKTSALFELPDFSLHAGACAAAITEALETLSEKNAVLRLWRKEAPLWKEYPGLQNKIVDRLGWLTVLETMAGRAAEVASFSEEILRKGFKEVVVIGMGGSSLCPELLAATFKSRSGIRVRVLDTTDPGAISRLDASLDLSKTLFILASKSGSTIEMISHYQYFDFRLRTSGIHKPEDHFSAITDEGSPLAKMALEKSFYKIFFNPTDIGGRFSALSFFGLVPGAISGMPVVPFLSRAGEMAERCRNQKVKENPGVLLGAALGVLAQRGVDKATFFLPPEFSGLGAWLEQLLAESTGKDGKGIVPVDGEPWGSPEVYGDDRFFVFWQMKDRIDPVMEGHIALLQKEEKPVFRILLNEMNDLSGEFFRWEIATAVAGIVMGINPFDEPNVTESKENTGKILEGYKKSKTLPQRAPAVFDKGLVFFSGPETDGCATLEEALKKFFNRAKAGSYLAIQVYLAPSEEIHQGLTRLRAAIRERLRLATTVGYGPRFLHSTGQLHKGGKPVGLFMQVTADDLLDLPIPGEVYTFGVLKQAQAMGDLGSLRRRNLPVIQIGLQGGMAGSPAEGLNRLAGIVEQLK